MLGKCFAGTFLAGGFDLSSHVRLPLGLQPGGYVFVIRTIDPKLRVTLTSFCDPLFKAFNVQRFTKVFLMIGVELERGFQETCRGRRHALIPLIQKFRDLFRRQRWSGLGLLHGSVLLQFAISRRVLLVLVVNGLCLLNCFPVLLRPCLELGVLGCVLLLRFLSLSGDLVFILRVIRLEHSPLCHLLRNRLVR